ncbi:MAG: cation:proton antiporter [Dehalococcoidia bacterium]|nr:cation:proton antiporter [Dehalococcoidia bacterium]
MNLVLALGIIIIAGFLGGLAASKLKFPRVTGYIIIGVLLSPSLLNIIPKGAIENLNIVTEIALGLIAYLIGGSLKTESLRKLGKNIATIVPFEALGAWFLVALFLAILGHLVIPNQTFWQFYFPVALIIGAISCATAPAATMAIISEYKAKGPLTTTLLAVVALDDAVAVLVFAIALGVCRPLVNSSDISFYQMLGAPLLHIVESAAIGTAFAVATIYISKLVRVREMLLVVVLGMIMLCAGVTSHLNLSSIMANMVIGFIIVNKVNGKEMFLVVEEIGDVIYTMFFVLAGLHFDLSVLKISGVLALLIVITRYTGKYFGARIGAQISHAPETVKKYLGLALLPQAGVALGLSLLATLEFPSFGAIILNGVLASVIINELITPPLTKYAISKAGESNIKAS